MPEVKEYVEGMFHWVDLATADVEASKSFYLELFGWKDVDMPMGGGQVYTMLQKNDKNVCGLYSMGEEQRKQGIPSHWMAYINVNDVDETAAKVAPAGGQLLMEPSDVGESGRMAMIQDPTGATVALWQPKTNEGSSLYGEHGALGWTELLTTDTEKAEAFFSQVFGYSTEHQQMGPTEYILFKVGDKEAAGMMQIAPEWGEVPPHWMVYFVVDDCDAMVDKATQMGAHVLVPPQDIPEVGRFATLTDPQGASFSIIQMIR